MDKPVFRYDAFLSYSHAVDSELCPRLQHALQTIGKPFYAVRRLRVFRDKTGLGMTPELWSDIERNLRRSRTFLLLASEPAAGSEWVQKEVNWWLQNRSYQSLYILRTDGDIAWDQARRDFDWQRTTCLPKAQLQGAYQEAPKFVDLTFARNAEKLDLRNGPFREAVLDIASTLLGANRDDLDGTDIREHKRFATLAWAGVVMLTLVTLLAVRYAWLESRQRRQAQDRLTAVYRANAAAAMDRDDWLVAAHWSARAAAANADSDPESARRALLDIQLVSSHMWVASMVESHEMRLSQDRRLFLARKPGTAKSPAGIGLYRTSDGTHVADLSLPRQEYLNFAFANETPIAVIRAGSDSIGIARFQLTGELIESGTLEQMCRWIPSETPIVLGTGANDSPRFGLGSPKHDYFVEWDAASLVLIRCSDRQTVFSKNSGYAAADGTLASATDWLSPRGARFTQDAGSIVAWGDGGVRFWSVASDGPPTKGLRKDTSVPVDQAAINAAQDRLVTAGQDGIQGWWVSDGKSLGGLSLGLESYEYSRPGALFASDGVHYLGWSKTQICEGAIPGANCSGIDTGWDVIGAAFDKTENFILGWGRTKGSFEQNYPDHHIRLWQRYTHQAAGPLYSGIDPQLPFDGEFLVTTDAEHRTILWDIANTTSTALFEGNSEGIPVNASLLRSAYATIPGVAFERQLQYLRSGEPLPPAPVPDQALPRLGGAAEEKRIWTIVDRWGLVKMETPSGQLTDSPGSAEVWDLSAGKRLKKWEGKDIARGLFGPADDTVVTADENGVVTVWSLPSMRASTYPIGDSFTWFLGFDPRRQRVAARSISQLDEIELRPLQSSGQPIRIKDPAPNGAVVKFSRNGSRVLTVGDSAKSPASRPFNTSARLWRADNGRQIFDLAAANADFDSLGAHIVIWGEQSGIRSADDGRSLSRPLGLSMNAGFSHDARIAFFETPQGILAIDTRDGSRVPISLRGALDWLSANDRWAISGGTLVDLGADFDFPAQHVPLLLEVLTGTQLDEGGSVHFLSAQDWSRKRTEYKTIAEGHLGQCRFRHSNAYVRQQAVWSRLK